MLLLTTDPMPYETFLARFTETADGFLAMGYTRAETLAMCGRVAWIQDYLNSPSMFEIAPALPKGLKWSQGIRLGSVKARGKGKKTNSTLGILFLDHGDDLYVRDLFAKLRQNPDGSVYRDEKGLRYVDPCIGVLHHWKNYCACDITNEIIRCWRGEVQGIPEVLLSAFWEFWHMHGCGIYEFHCVRDPKLPKQYQITTDDQLFTFPSDLQKASLQGSCQPQRG